jgi:hypothetical protein
VRSSGGHCARQPRCFAPAPRCCCLVVLAGLAVVLRAEPQPRRLRIHIHVYNYAELSDKILSDAEQTAARIFLRMEIGTEWVICPIKETELVESTACDAPGESLELIVRLLSNTMAHRLPLGRDFFGIALLPPRGGFGVIANVFAERAKEMAGGKAPLGSILGALIAHELGHLLLNQSLHSVAGVMCGRWRGQELQRAVDGALCFLPEQAKVIRAQVFARALGAGRP